MIEKNEDLIIRKVGNGFYVIPHRDGVGGFKMNQLMVFQKLDGYGTEQTLLDFISKHFKEE